MKKVIKSLFRFNVTKETGLAVLMGLLMIVLSFLMIPFGGDSLRDMFISFILRDFLMIFGLGVAFVSGRFNVLLGILYHPKYAYYIANTVSPSTYTLIALTIDLFLSPKV